MLDPAAGLPSFAAAARPGRRVGHHVEVHEAIGSTNDRARALLAEPGGEGVAVVAEEQLAGRGRRGRRWVSPSGLNLMLSVGLRPRLAAADAWQLGLAVALAARDAAATLAPVELKWPNDLVAADGRKLGGVLVETVVDGDTVAEAVVGIGLNVNWRVADMPAELAASATSLTELAGAEVDRPALLGRLLTALDAEIGLVESGASPLDRYRSACRTLGTSVEVDLGGRVVAGWANGLDATGALLLTTGEGVVAVRSGDIVHARPAVSA